MYSYQSFVSHRAKTGYDHSTFGWPEMTISGKYTAIDDIHGRTFQAWQNPNCSRALARPFQFLMVWDFGWSGALVHVCMHVSEQTSLTASNQIVHEVREL